MIHLKDCSKENLIRVIAKMTDSVGKFSNYNTGYDDETCDLLNSIGSQAIKECETIGWEIK